MILGGIIELLIGIKAEGKSLEKMTKPLTASHDRRPSMPRLEEDEMDELRRHHHRQRRGRRHARPAPRAVGQAHPAARTRRLAAARAAELVGPGRVRGQPLRLAGHVVRRERQALPARRPLRRRRSDEALRRRPVPASQGGLRRAAASRRRLARLADRLRRTGALLLPRGAALPGARRARRGPDRASGERALPASRRVARAADPAARRRPRGGRATGRSTRRAGSCSTSRTRLSRRAFAVRPATASRASCTRSPTPRCSAFGRRSSTRT